MGRARGISTFSCHKQHKGAVILTEIDFKGIDIRFHKRRTGRRGGVKYPLPRSGGEGTVIVDRVSFRGWRGMAPAIPGISFAIPGHPVLLVNNVRFNQSAIPRR